MNTKRTLLIAIIILSAGLIGLSGYCYYIWSQSGLAVSEPTANSFANATPSPTTTFKFSEPELELLWLNGEKCPKRGFAIQSPPEDIVQAPDGSRVFVNIVNVNFIDNTEACEDAERIAVLLNGRIVGFGPVTNLYGIEIPTRTLEALEAAIQKVEALDNPKIEGVFRAVALTHGEN